MVKKQAKFISSEVENDLWEKGVLGEQNPDQLRETVLFLLGINLGLRAGDEHYDLRRDSLEKPSQISFKRASNGKCCLVYREDSVTKTNDGGLSSLKKDRKIRWVYPNDENVNHCPVCLVDKYVSLLPPVMPKAKRFNFYMRSLEKPNPAQWYGEQAVGKHTLRKVVGKLLKTAKLDGFFSNHSLRRLGTMRLFRAGVDRKIVKEYTGHVSDAVDKYQVTSDEQNEELSMILGGQKRKIGSEVSVKLPEESNETVSSDRKVTSEQVEQIDKNEIIECKCQKTCISLDKSEDIGKLLNILMSANVKGKAKLKIEIEFME